MREVLLVLMQDCKWHIAVSIGFLVIVVLGVNAIRGFFALDPILAALIGYSFFVAMLWNVGLVYMPSVDENSNDAVVFSRWVLILISLFMLLYFLIEPFYVN